jgi:adenine-specific DNA-methyltransferase
MKNQLIFGDNLTVLKARLPELQNRIQCAYIDPPYNTGTPTRGNQQSAGYTDRFESSEWLEKIKPRVAAIRDCLAPQGSLFVHLDDNEVDYMKVALDSLFGRENFVNRIVVKVRAPSSFSTVNAGLFKSNEYILWYAKDKKQLKHFPLRIARDPDPAYRLWLNNPAAKPEDWTFSTLKSAHPKADLNKIRLTQADRVCRLAPISDTKASKATIAAKACSKANPDTVVVVPRENHPPQFLLRGNQVVFYSKQVQEIDGKLCASAPLTTIWTDIPWEGIAKEGGVVYKTGKKPERLIRRCLQLCTEEGDWVLDAYAGSGSTPATAHKMNRKWVAIEKGEAIQLAKARLEAICAGSDVTGISKICDWKGGGEFDWVEKR